MNAVTPIDSNVKPTIDDVCRWYEQKGQGGELPESTARFKVSALRQLVSVMLEEEPRDDAEFVLNNVDSIARRWATKNGGFKADTVRTYASRARSALEDYFRWRRDPARFEFRRERTEGATPKPRSAKKATADESNTTPTVDAVANVPASAATPNDVVRGSFPLGGGRFFRFELPTEPTVTDIRRAALHLMTYAVDLDPTMPAEAFAIVRSKD